MRLFISAILISVSLATIAFADTQLAPGKPAGVKQAVNQTTELYLFGAAAVVAVGLGIVAFKIEQPTTATGTAS